MASLLLGRSRIFTLHKNLSLLGPLLNHTPSPSSFFPSTYNPFLCREISHASTSNNSATLSSSSRFESTKAEAQLGLDQDVCEDDHNQVIDFPGGKVAFTSEMRLISESPQKRVPCYRVLDDNGELVTYSNYVQISKEMAVKMYSDMVTLQTMDIIFYEVQRQGRISFYLTSMGEEAVNIASAAALTPDDIVLPQLSIEVKVAAGFPIKQVLLQEVANYNASWIILDRHLRRDLRFHLNKMPCKVALVKDDLSLDIWRSHNAHDTKVTELRVGFSLSKFVSLSDCHSIEDIEQSIISCKSHPQSIASSDSSGTIKSYLKQSSVNRSREHSSISDYGSSSKHERSGITIKGEHRHFMTSQIDQKQNQCGFLPKSSDAPILCAGCGTRTELSIKESTRFSYSDIQHATDDFSKDNLLGEGGYGHVYKGKLKDGQEIAAKVRKEESSQGFSEFHSEVYVLSFARHKNIVMLLGYCCKESKNILIYEYICNKSLHWHLFENNATVLEWNQRYAIAVGTAKGLRFLHEECRGGPIIHRDMRPSNILLTHEFVPMLGDFGLAKWKTGDDTLQTRIMGTLGYLAPEYAEDGIVSVRTDVYSYGIVLLQLISGRQVGNCNNQEQQQSLRQWAEPLIEKLALHELIDTRLGESYDTYQLYLMAKAAYFCVQRKPEMRPSMGEVVRLLEGESSQFHALEGQFVPNCNG